MKSYILNNTYYIEDDKGEVIFSVTPDNTKEGNQVVIQTQTEVYAGPINLLTFTSMFVEESGWEGK